MSLFEALTQGLGFALAFGIAISAVPGEHQRLMPLAAAIGGAFVFAISLHSEHRSVFVGIPVGALAAAFAYSVSRGVVAGARKRARGSSGVSALVVAAAVVLGGASLVFGPASLLALAALIWLAAGRRRRAKSKYAGLRSLR